MSEPRMHRCPACRTRDIEWPRLVCADCWPTLPAKIRAALIEVADRADPAAWLDAVGAALDWIVAERSRAVAWKTAPRATRRRAA